MLLHLWQEKQQLVSILKKSLKDLKKTMGDTINFVDVDYEVIPDHKTTRSTIMKDERAIANAYRLWLQSGKFDYIRNPNFGGFFDNQLNDRFPFSPDSEEDVKIALINETKEKWPDLILINTEVKCNFAQRNWWIRTTIADRNTGLVSTEEATIPVST
jgi:hypothetical protein